MYFRGERCGFSWTVIGFFMSENNNDNQPNTTSLHLPTYTPKLTPLDVDQGLELLHPLWNYQNILKVHFVLLELFHFEGIVQSPFL